MGEPHAPAGQVLLICSVGGSDEPVIKSIREQRPARVVFVVSKGSESNIPNILHAVGDEVPEGATDRLVLQDPQDLASTVEDLRPLAARVREWTRRGDDHSVVVDYTGGTKVMSAALLLVAHRWPCTFSYVGGTKRTKDNLGVVVTGSESIMSTSNPWDTLGYQTIEEATLVFNRGGYASAALLLDNSIKRARSASVKRELATLKAVVEAYALWDRFAHREAVSRFEDALQNQNDLKVMFTDSQDLILRLRRHRDMVLQLSTAEGPTEQWIVDLVHNARRRAAEGRYDDAVARLYRAVEALAQVRLKERHNIAKTESIPLERLPDPLRSQWQHDAHNGTISIGLRKAYELLQALNDDLGLRYKSSLLASEKKSPLLARNRSILAHGFEPVSRKTYEALHNELCQLAVIPESEDWSLPAPA